jgi:hypothetical protein
MSTNYYVTQRGKYSLHIGKKSAGWRFVFHGYRSRDLMSRLQWQEFLTEGSGQIQDEDGHFISVDDFLQKVEETKLGMNVEQYYEAYPSHRDQFIDELLKHQNSVDAEGFDFSTGDFS